MVTPGALVVEPTSYINASYVRGPVFSMQGKASSSPQSSSPSYIVTQSPLPNTVDDFLTMVATQKCPLIIMLCRYVAETLNAPFVAQQKVKHRRVLAIGLKR